MVKVHSLAERMFLELRFGVLSARHLPGQIIPKVKDPRATTLESLARLKPVVREGGTVTAGNSSGVNDRAAALLVASEAAAARHGLTP